MAAAHREAARLDQAGFDGDLVMDSLPVAGLQTTDPRDPEDTVTDSAAAATAWATGQKTFNGAISVDVEGKPVTPLGTEAKRAGKATGLVTTAQVTDATPAAFFSSVEDRGE
jgi:alkaline phosphatase